MLPDSKLYYKKSSHQNSMVLVENRHIDQWNRIESPVINLCLYGQLNYKEGDKYTQWRKGSLFNTLFWENCIAICKTMACVTQHCKSTILKEKKKTSMTTKNKTKQNNMLPFYKRVMGE